MPVEDSLSTVDRRTFCKYLGGSGLAATGALSVGTAAGDTLEDDYGTVIDVADAGAATDGSESVAPVLSDLVDNDTLLKFPEGRYYFDEQVRLTDFWNLGLVGYDATLVPASYWNFDGPEYRLFRLGTPDHPGHTLRIDSFTVDQTAASTGIRAFEAQVEDNLAVEWINVVGEHDSGTWGPGLFTITDPDGSGYVKKLRARDGAQASGNTPGNLWRGPTGILCNGAHRGTITFEDCVLGAFPDNGLYASGGDGVVNVHGGHYENSGTASIRLGASSGEIRGTDIVVDEDPFDLAQEGIRLDYGNWFTIEDLDVQLLNPTNEGIRVTGDVDGAIVRDSQLRIERPAYVGIMVDEGSGPTYVTNVDIEINDSNNAILIEGKEGGKVGLSDVYIGGDAGGNLMRHAIRCERDDAAFRDVGIAQHGGNQRRGICVLGDDSLLYSCYVATSDRPVTLKGDDAWLEDCGLKPDGDAASLRMFDGVDGVRLKSNWFPGGIADMGASDVVETGTSG